MRGASSTNLQVTKDGVLVCLHDRTLERTTNVCEVFPRRGQVVREGGEIVRRWFVHDFNLAEIQQLDAGSWFRPEFAGARVPTFDDLLAWARNRVAVLTELKDPDVYETLGVEPASARADGEAIALVIQAGRPLRVKLDEQV